MVKSLRVVGLFAYFAFLFRKVIDLHGRIAHLLQSTSREQYNTESTELSRPGPPLPPVCS